MLSEFIKKPHLTATRVLGYALTLGDAESWQGTSTVWRVQLSVEERIALGRSALQSLDAPDVKAVLRVAGAPVPPFIGPIEEALSWAKFAGSNEINAYVFTSFNALPAARRRDFLKYAQEVM